ncbi:MAG: riboflavin synthase [Thermoleophilia bacterium]|nr:riboflavin synthase [Thermoleophilia bacterium]
MFTGIVSHLGTIVATRPTRLTIDAPGCEREGLGASIAINGCCLTIVSRDGDVLDFDILPETYSHTNLGDPSVGGVVNLEPALRAGDALGGHWVQGHIDATGTVTAVAKADDGSALNIELELPPQIVRYCLDRGSLTINGVSLTVMEMLADDIGVRVQLVPETQERTNLGRVRVGERVNLEADILARYVERMLGNRAQGVESSR